jgi:hypothetical protein
MDIGKIKLKLIGVLVNRTFNSIDIFNENCQDVRDDCVSYLRLIKSNFDRHDIFFDQPSAVTNLSNVDFSLDFEIPPYQIEKYKTRYLVRFECEHIHPESYKISRLSEYKRIFSWSDFGVGSDRFVKIQIPNKFIYRPYNNLMSRSGLCCMIAGNKSVASSTPLELYSERVNTIRWFEKNAPQAFDLFGGGWDTPAVKPGMANRIIRKLKSFLPINNSEIYFPSYCGKVTSKLETLQNYRFSICYENIRHLPGYITEKIWDCFFAGCVPVYWGASNITDYIPEDCFIDRRKFSNHEELYKFMVTMTEAEYSAYQARIAAFLSSENARPFSAEAFAETIVKNIVSDFELAI